VGANGAAVDVLTASKSSDFDGDGTTSRSGTFQGKMACRVIAVLPGGVLHIRGRRHVVVNHDAQYITLEGLVRVEDISVNNTVPSVALAEARLTYDGLGVLDDKQRPGLLARVLDWLYPL
jgi:flagellar L-ring protein precursor FlgH